MTWPALFVSHGSPMLALEDSPARRFLQGLAATGPRPKAVLVISAHWESMGGPAVSRVEKPETIHDFGGFPPALYQIQYPAPGAPALAEAVAARLENAGFNVKRSDQRGLDHGAWVPLSLLYPAADVPVLQLSVMRGATTTDHWRMGLALAALRAEGVLILGSGSFTHNLYEISGNAMNTAAPAWVADFADWMSQRLLTQNRADLLDYRRLAPNAARNHPTEEHILPLFVALGAGGEAAAVNRLHHSYQHSVLAMDAYAFG